MWLASSAAHGSPTIGINSALALMAAGLSLPRCFLMGARDDRLAVALPVSL